MSRSSIHRVVFSSDEQWESGPHLRLRVGTDGGMALSPRPALERWMQLTDRQGRPLDRPLEGIEVDACGQLFWIERETGDLVRWNPRDGTEDGRHPMRVVDDAAGPVSAGGLLWVLDRGHARLLGFDAHSLQIIREVRGFTEPMAFAFDGRSRMYVADAEGLHVLSDLGVRESVDDTQHQDAPVLRLDVKECLRHAGEDLSLENLRFRTSARAGAVPHLLIYQIQNGRQA